MTGYSGSVPASIFQGIAPLDGENHAIEHGGLAAGVGEFEVRAVSHHRRSDAGVGGWVLVGGEFVEVGFAVVVGVERIGGIAEVGGGAEVLLTPGFLIGQRGVRIDQDGGDGVGRKDQIAISREAGAAEVLGQRDALLGGAVVSGFVNLPRAAAPDRSPSGRRSARSDSCSWRSC